MPKIDISDEIYERLEKLVTNFGDTPEIIIARLLAHAPEQMDDDPSGFVKNKTPKRFTFSFEEYEVTRDVENGRHLIREVIACCLYMPKKEQNKLSCNIGEHIGGDCPAVFIDLNNKFIDAAKAGVTLSPKLGSKKHITCGEKPKNFDSPLLVTLFDPRMGCCCFVDIWVELNQPIHTASKLCIEFVKSIGAQIRYSY